MRGNYEDLIQQALENMQKECEWLSQECDRQIAEQAKREGKTENQVVKEMMAKYEGKTCGEVWDELKGDDEK